MAFGEDGMDEYADASVGKPVTETAVGTGPGGNGVAPATAMPDARAAFRARLTAARSRTTASLGAQQQTGVSKVVRVVGRKRNGFGWGGMFVAAGVAFAVGWAASSWVKSRSSRDAPGGEA